MPLSLTTVWFFPHRKRLVLVHHGQAELAEEDGSDIARIVLGADRLGALRPPDVFHAVMQRRMNRRDGAALALRDADLVPAKYLPPDAGLVKPPDPATLELRARTRRNVERQIEAQRAAVRAHGLDPDQFAPKPAPPAELPDMSDLPALIAGARVQAEAARESALAEVAARKTDLGRRLAATGMAEPEIRQRLEAKPKGPPPFSADAFRAELAGRARAMRVLGQLTLGLEAQLASPAFNAQLAQAEAALRNTYRLSAQHQDKAEALARPRSDELRRLITEDSAAARVLYDLHGADLSGLDLSGLDLSAICLDGAQLDGTSFAGANLTDAVLAHASMGGCVLDGAELSGANLGRAHLAGASLRRATLKRAVLAGADLTDAVLVGADLEEADLSEACLTGADLCEVQAPGILALKLSLRGLRARFIRLDRAKFIECDLEDADLTGASLEQAVFLNTNLTGIWLAGAHMRKSVFVQHCALSHADLSGADLTEANLRETVLRMANLDGAIVERADLSGADLTSALLTRLRGAGSRWVAAVLRDAMLINADLSQTDLSRADLRGADLTGVCAYEANLPRVQLDADTIRVGMQVTRLRYLPVRPADEAAAA